MKEVPYQIGGGLDGKFPAWPHQTCSVHCTRETRSHETLLIPHAITLHFYHRMRFGSHESAPSMPSLAQRQRRRTIDSRRRFLTETSEGSCRAYGNGNVKHLSEICILEGKKGNFTRRQTTNSFAFRRDFRMHLCTETLLRVSSHDDIIPFLFFGS